MRVPTFGAEQLCTLNTSFANGVSFARMPGSLITRGCPTAAVKKSLTANGFDGFDGLVGFAGF